VVQNIPCPHCRQVLGVGQALPLNLRCPRCQTRFHAAADGSTAVLGQIALPLAARAPAAPLPTQLATLPLAAPAKPGIGTRLVLLGAVAGVVCLFLALGAGLLAYCLWTPVGSRDVGSDDPLPAGASNSAALPLQPVAFTKHGPPMGRGVGTVVPGTPSPDAPAGIIKDVSSQPSPPANQKEIDAAIKKAVAWLKGRVTGNGVVAGTHLDRVGAAAFVGLTLLSCGVPADDPAIVSITQRVRTEGRKEIRIYDLSCCIWFLDKLGSADDVALIRSMALRLMAGQTASGGWHYTCQALTADQETQLLVALVQPLQEPARGGPPCPVLQYSAGQKVPAMPGDNSNTQFAVLALWAAQKHGVPVARSLSMAEARFRQFQMPDGSWTYRFSSPPLYKDAMTCAGLVCLAAGQGNRAGDMPKDQAAPGAAVKDEHIDRALTFLGQRLKAWMDRTKDRPGVTLSMMQADAMGELYVLWSIERVGVLCDLDTIGGQNWFAWGSELLLQTQKAAGSWEAREGDSIDTCFALLFLKRVNVAHDLTKVLHDLGGVRDPGGKPKAPASKGELTAGNKVIPSIQPGASKVRSGYALPTGQQAARTRRRRFRKLLVVS
jgi:hypothetical protein